MRVRRFFEIRWYHILIALLGLVAILFVLFWLFVARGGPKYFVEDETDLVD